MKNPLTLEAFAEWLEKQPQDMEYDGIDPGSCILARYYQACGFADWFDRSFRADCTCELSKAAFGFVTDCPDGFTVAHALRRARALIARDTSLGMRAEDVS